MGLDWCLVFPCEKIKALQNKDVLSWEEMLKRAEKKRDTWKDRWREVKEAKARLEEGTADRMDMLIASSRPTEKEMEDWFNTPIESLLEEIGNKYVCEECPALSELPISAGAVVPTPCMFPAMRLLEIDTLPKALKDDASKDRNPAEMIEYAQEFELLLFEGDFSKGETIYIQAAADWLRYWASKSVSLWAWY